MTELIDILKQTEYFFTSQIDDYGRGWEPKFLLPEIIHTGRHGKWISFKHSVNMWRMDIAHNLQVSPNMEISIRIVQRILSFYLDIVEFIESRRTDIPEEEVRDTSREGIAIELKSEIFKTFELIKDICPQALPDKYIDKIHHKLSEDSVKDFLQQYPDAKIILERLRNEGYLSFLIDGRCRWEKSAKLYGYFIDLFSNKISLRPSNGRIPWKRFRNLFSNHEELLMGAKQGVNDYQNKDLSKPFGYEIIYELCRD